MSPTLDANAGLNANIKPESPSVAILQVSSNVDGVTVFVDGKLQGTVSISRPIQIALSPGEHFFQAQKSGYKAWEYSRGIAAKTRDSLLIEMTPAGPTPQDLAYEYLQKADRLLTQGQYDDAMTACQEGLRFDSGNQLLLIKKAEIENARQEYLNALLEEEERRRRAEQQNIEKRADEPFQPAVALQNNKMKPIYPQIARSVRVYGKVIVQVNIDDRGNVTSARALEGSPLLQRAAIDAAKHWKYRPARRGNRAVEDTQTIVFNFTL